jgi:hypothetical protein
MKRFLIAIAAFVLVGIFTTSCNNYVCPAYSQNNQQQTQQDNTGS